jgi:hypothetical protein
MSYIRNLNIFNCFVKLTYYNEPEVFATNELPFSIIPSNGVSEINDNPFKLQCNPNPIKDKAFITYSMDKEDCEDLKLELINSSGQLVKTEILPDSMIRGNNFTINTSNLESGLYYIKVSNESNFSIIKVIKK